MIFLATDFGLAGPYVGQVKTRLWREAPGVEIIDLFADLPHFRPKLAAYLLPAYGRPVLEPGDVLLAVVDPGVGGDRLPLMMKADDRWFVGPDNGLFELIRRRAQEVKCFAIDWRPAKLSASFHGRDLFAPVAAKLATGQSVSSSPMQPITLDHWPDDLNQIVYIDHYGNGMTGLRASFVTDDTVLTIAGMTLESARTFSDQPPESAFWYENANGLLEIAVNGASAATRLGLSLGMKVAIHRSG